VTQASLFTDEIGTPSVPVATFNYASSNSALGIVVAYKSTPPLAANMNFTVNATLLWDDGTPVTGTLEALQWQNGSYVSMTPNTGLDATGAQRWTLRQHHGAKTPWGGCRLSSVCWMPMAISYARPTAAKSAHNYSRRSRHRCWRRSLQRYPLR